MEKLEHSDNLYAPGQQLASLIHPFIHLFGVTATVLAAVSADAILKLSPNVLPRP